MSILNRLESLGLIHPPKWLITNVHYMTLSGSVSYGVSADNSDNDIVGFAIPQKEMIFPHLCGEIEGFGKQKKRFNQWQEHHVDDKSAGKMYDFTIYSIVTYFNLCMGNNPNMIDSLFTPVNCVIHSTSIGNMVRENRKIFLHKGCWPKFKGYAYSQMYKIEHKDPDEGGKRRELIEKYGYDTKHAYNVIRLMDEVEQILTLGDLDLQRAREQMKSVRRGEWKLEDIKQHFQTKEKVLEEVYAKSTLPWGPDEPRIKQLLLDCLEHHFGSLDKCVAVYGNFSEILGALDDAISKLKKALSASNM